MSLLIAPQYIGLSWEEQNSSRKLGKDAGNIEQEELSTQYAEQNQHVLSREVSGSIPS